MTTDVDEGSSAQSESPARLRVGTWNMNHWQRTAAHREEAWSQLTAWGLEIVLLQETVPPASWPRDRFAYRPIGGSRPWGSAVVAVSPDIAVAEIDAVRTRYSPRLFSMLGTYPGASIVARARVPDLGSISLVSVYGLIEVYAQTTMLRIVADLIPLFDSVDGEHVILGGDFNIGTSGPRDAREYGRYAAILHAVESLGLVNLAEVAPDHPPRPADCQCGDPDCHHLRTFRTGQLDHLYATPDLARRCRRLWVPADEASALSDHAPILVDFDMSRSLERTEWDVSSFQELLAARHGAKSARILAELLSWAERKQRKLHRTGRTDVRLDRLPCQLDHGQPKLWVQLDHGHPARLQWLFAVRADGQIELQFQYMAGPFATVDARRTLWDRLAAIQGINPDMRLSGRPTFPLSALRTEGRLSALLRAIEYVVDETLGNADNAVVDGSRGEVPEELETETDGSSG